MRKALLASVLAFSMAVPAAAQTLDTLDRRVNKLEREVRAVQREVFPGGDERFFEPEVRTGVDATGPVDTIGVATPSAVLTERLDALELQLQSLTGQIEEMAFKQRQLTERLEIFEGDTKLRLEALERGGAQLAAVDPDDPEGGALLMARRLYDEGDFAGAQSAYLTFLDDYPDSDMTSEAGFWVGRALLEQGQAVAAVQALLENYQERREGARGPDSLLWVGRSLMAIEPPRADRACEAYDRLEDEYAGRYSDEVAAGLAEARLEAECS